MPEELNKKALDVINRVNNKLTGRDFAGFFLTSSSSFTKILNIFFTKILKIVFFLTFIL